MTGSSSSPAVSSADRSTALPTFHRVVVGANAHADLVPALRAARPSLEVRGARFTDLTADDLAWGDCYVGFKRPPVGTMGNIRWVHCTGAGVDAWFMPEPLPADITLTRSSESFGPRIAEWVVSRVLAFTQRLPELQRQQDQRVWDQIEPTMLAGSRALVVGTGDVGTHSARLLAAMGCTVTGVSRTGRGDPSVFANVATVDRMADLVGDADWIVLTLPLTTATRGMFDRAMMSRCRGAALVNVGRGGVVEEAALPEAMDAGWLGGCALDVFEVEPLPAASPLWSHPRAIVSPHISGLTTNEGVVRGFMECLTDFEQGRTPRWTVDRTHGY